MRFFLILLFPAFSLAQTWPTKNCPDVPYTKGNDGIIYHTCKCDTVRKFLCGPLYCPECNHITNQEHMDALRAGTDPDKWNADMQQALSEGCPIKEHRIFAIVTSTSSSGSIRLWQDTIRTRSQYINGKLVKQSKTKTSSPISEIYKP